jgi:hypothetical protein
LARASDGAATSTGLPSTMLLKVSLVYANGTKVVDVTSDNRTVFDLSFSNGFFMAQVTGDGTQVAILPAAGTTVGQGTLLIRFTHEAITFSANITVVASSDLHAVAHPFPTYADSSNVNITSLSVIHGTQPAIRQQASLQVFLYFSDGSFVDITVRMSQISFQVLDSLNATASSYVSITTSSNSAVLKTTFNSEMDSQIFVKCSFAGFAGASSLQLTLSSQRVYIVELNSLTCDAGGTLRGIINIANSQLRLGARLSDGTRFTALLSGAKPSIIAALPGLLSFWTSSSSLSVDASLGAVTLLKNNFAPSSIVVTAPSSNNANVSTSINIYTNLDPDLGDVDIGNEAGLPIDAQSPGATFQVPITVNTGSLTLGGFEIAIHYDPSILQVVQMDQAFSGGVFAWVASDSTPGLVTFSGAYGQTGSSRFTLAVITVKALKSGQANIMGTIVTLSQANVQGSPIGNAGVPRDIVAGRVNVSPCA